MTKECKYWDSEIKTCRRSEVPRIAIPLDVNLDEAIRNEEFKVVRAIDLPEPKIENRWIPVTERLPEAVEEVIVTRQYCNLFVDDDPIDTTVAEYWGELNGKPYFKQHGSQLVGKVLAWMPLPKPWKGDEE